MDRRRRIEQQIRLVLLTYRYEERRHADTIAEFRDRARPILDESEREAEPYPELLRWVADVRREIDGDASPGSTPPGGDRVSR